MRSLLAVLLLVACTLVHAGPIGIAKSGGVTITLYDEDCALDAVVNLPKRATWAEGGKSLEGCYGVYAEVIVGSYFEDKTVAVIPAEVFTPVEGI